MTHIYSSIFSIYMSITLISMIKILPHIMYFENFSENPTTSYGSEYNL